MTEPSLTVVMLAYNEASSIETAVAEVMACLEGLTCNSELLLVNDGSTDGTGEKANLLSARDPRIRTVHHPSNLGLGGGYRTGFTEAKGTFVTFFPADGQFPADIIPHFLSMIAHCDMVLGTIPNRPGSMWPKLLSAAERALYLCVFGRVPRFQGILMFRRSLLREMHLQSEGRGWAVLLEFVIKSSRRGCRILNAPTACRPRIAGASKVNNWRTIRSNLVQIWGLRRCL